MSAETDEETNQRNNVPTKWYPGKFVGLPNRRGKSQQLKAIVNVNDPSPAEKNDVISSFLGVNAVDNCENATSDAPNRNSFSMLNKKWFGRKQDEEKTKSSEPKQQDEEEDINEEMKKESMIARTVRGIRDKYVARKLIGRIYIYRMSGVISTAVTTKVGINDKKSEISDDLEDLSYYSRRALSITDVILTSLERRSRAWSGVDFSDEVLLTRGATFGISDPFFGAIGFSLTIELSATVTSLIASDKRNEEYKAMQEPRGSSFSFFRTMSFSGAPAPSMQSNKSASKLDSLQEPVIQPIIFSEDEGDLNAYNDAQRQLTMALRSKVLTDKRLESSNGWFIYDGGTSPSHDSGVGDS